VALGLAIRGSEAGAEERGGRSAGWLDDSDARECSAGNVTPTLPEENSA